MSKSFEDFPSTVIGITLLTSKSLENFIGTLEDYCLNKAMDEAKKTPLLSREEALKFLEEE